MTCCKWLMLFAMVMPGIFVDCTVSGAIKRFVRRTVVRVEPNQRNHMCALIPACLATGSQSHDMHCKPLFDYKLAPPSERMCIKKKILLGSKKILVLRERKEGRKEGRREGGREGKNEGRKGGREEGRKEAQST